ncbi:MAG TPA: tyrosine-type recombinase/integrase [Streptosporangiaceae bacterium]|nr:tyrosine-type recombinase/integrase [Streptosporangiaceae bacterium]
MTSATQRWSYSTGERGHNRVRAFAHPVTGLLFLEFSDGGRRRRVALSHTIHDAAKVKADELALALRKHTAPLEADPTLQVLFDNYGREVTPHKGLHTQQHDRRCTRLFAAFFGAERRASTLSRRDWDGFIAWRYAQGDGRTGRAQGRQVGARTVEYDLKFLHTVLNWAVMARDSAGRYLLQRNPLKGLPWPRAESPRRPVLTAKDYAAMLEVAPRVDARCALALVLAHETGHRIGAIRRLRWSDVDLEGKSLRWRGAQDKIGFDHETPLSGAALNALKKERKTHPVIGEAWVFPAPEDVTQPCSSHLVRTWWARMERRAGLTHEPGRGWHSLRRTFATELKDVPLPDLCQLGGWKNPQTIVKCYQRPDVGTMRAALASRARLGRGGALQRPNRHHESTPRVTT